MLEGNWRQLGLQLYGSVVCVLWSVVATYILLKMIDATLGLRVCIDDELLGLDMVSVLLLASQVPHSLAQTTASPSLPPSLSLSLPLSIRRSARPQICRLGWAASDAEPVLWLLGVSWRVGAAKRHDR